MFGKKALTLHSLPKKRLLYMNKIISYIRHCCCLLLLVVNTATAQDDSTLNQRLQLLLQDEIFETSTVGIKVYDLTADSTLFAYNDRQLMRPASTLKMMVAVTALHRLGADYNYCTTLCHTGKVTGATLHGDLYCRGGFDPAFSIHDMEAWADSLAAWGIDSIMGDLYADKSMKDTLLLGEGWCWDDDNPTLSPLLVGRKDNFTSTFSRIMKDKGIVLTGRLKEGRTPRSADVLVEKKRKLTDILERMMKKSDNLYAESMFYQLACDGSRHTTGSARQGRQAVNRLISALDYKPKSYYVADGSGLSLYNYVSPELEVAFLRHAFKHDDIYLPLLSSMPVAGVDGTLGKRMRRGAAYRNVRAKTGTVTGVSALAGYCTAPNGHILCFSIINMGITDAEIGRNFQDKVCETLCQP